MRKFMLAICGAALLSVAALAVGDIPTRYSGSFPSDGIRTNITGTYTGKTLTLRFVRVVNNRTLNRAFSSTCTEKSPTKIRCDGTYQGVGDDKYSAPGTVIVTWSAGRPVATTFAH
jgi:hypothetical protein